MKKSLFSYKKKKILKINKQSEEKPIKFVQHEMTVQKFTEQRKLK